MEGMVDKARRQLGMFRVLLTLIAAIIMALILYTLTLDKIRSIALLKLIGAPNRVILGLILQQAFWGRLLRIFKSSILRHVSRSVTQRQSHAHGRIHHVPNGAICNCLDRILDLRFDAQSRCQTAGTS